MKTIYVQLTLFLITLSVLQSCLDSDSITQIRPESEEFILIYGYISPEHDSLKVSVSRTVAFFDVDSRSGDAISDFAIKDATVRITNESGMQVDLTYNPETFNYEEAATDLEILPGATYFLQVDVNGEQFTSSCTIPLDNVQKLTYSVKEVVNTVGKKDDEITITFEDINDQKNYYFLSLAVENDSIDSFNTSLNLVLDDNDIEDGLFTTRKLLSNTSEKSQGGITLSTIDKNMYETFRIFELNGGFFDFFRLNTEIIIPPNNIIGEGGLGIFGGYRIIKEEIQF